MPLYRISQEGSFSDAQRPQIAAGITRDEAPGFHPMPSVFASGLIVRDCPGELFVACVVAEAEESACTRTVHFLVSHPVSFKPSASRQATLAMGAASLVAASLRPARFRAHRDQIAVNCSPVEPG